MSQRVIYKSPAPNNPLSRGKAPIHLSPRSKQKQQNIHRQEDSSLTPPKNSYLAETAISNENVLKGLQQHPLEFSSNRKHKSKQIQPGPALSQLNSFVGPLVYARNVGVQPFQNGKFSNENQNTQASLTNFSNKFQGMEILKLRNYYQNQVRSLRDSQIIMQEEYNQKYRQLEKQKNSWREKYMKIKQQFHQYKKAMQQRQKPKSNTKQAIQQYGFTLNRYNNNKPNVTVMNQNIINLQQQINNVNKSLKVAENQIYSLNKLKAELNYQIAKLSEDNKKANTKIFEQDYHIEKLNRNISELNEKIRKIQQVNVDVAKSLDLKPESLSGSIDSRVLANNQNIIHHKKGEMEERGSQRSHSSSSTRSRSSSSSLSSSLSIPSKHKSSRHHRSNSNNVHGGSSHRSMGNNIPPELMHMQINFDFNKQMDKMKHACRKLQKTVVNQNQQIMMDGLKRLNVKYAHFDENGMEKEHKICQQYEYYNRGNFSNESRIGGQSNLYSFCQPHELNQSTKATYDSKPNSYW